MYLPKELNVELWNLTCEIQNVKDSLCKYYNSHQLSEEQDLAIYRCWKSLKIATQSIDKVMDKCCECGFPFSEPQE